MLLSKTTLDLEQHHNYYPRLYDDTGLHVLTENGERLNVGHVEPRTYSSSDVYFSSIDVEEAGCLNGQWFLLRETSEHTEILRFSDRESLISFLWDEIDCDAWALQTLRQLDALRLNKPETALDV